MRIVDEEGAEALSMRTLAKHLGSGTATLYRHFDNRAEVVAQVADRLFGMIEVEPQPAATEWREACRTMMENVFAVLRRHRRVAPLLMEETPAGPNARAVRERCVGILLDNGFPPKTAAQAYATLARYVLGFAMQLGEQGRPGDKSADERAATPVHPADPSLYPATTRVAAFLPVPLEDEFSFGLGLLIEGLAQLRDGV
ncbi:TetR/AcrR family transcriptional regulator [Streptomyces sp. NPDC087420]|uniref:TetR/AcrR family transcriptional regulator n=1 Tax=Streptomyces sp. NPDC087420 TaxID=3365785 RepID=UPI003836C3A8